MNGNGYIRTDLASESAASGSPGVKSAEYETLGFPVTETTVSEAGERSSGTRAGKYVTVTVGRVWLYGKENAEKAVNAVSGLLLDLIKEVSGEEKPTSVLTVCLGNRAITSDAVGPFCAEKLIVTRHLKSEKAELFRSFGNVELSVVTPGVTGETGIETEELIKAACETVKPSLILCVDALAARSPERLTVSVQLTDTGISPGSGVGNFRKEISKKTFGVPVISLGIPTVVHSSTLVYDALEKAGISGESEALSEVLESGRSFFVTPKNADVSVKAMSELAARAINNAFLGFSEL